MARHAQVGRPPIPARLRKTRRLHMLLTPDEHKKLTEYARQQDTTVSELMRAHIRALLGQMKEVKRHADQKTR